MWQNDKQMLTSPRFHSQNVSMYKNYYDKWTITVTQLSRPQSVYIWTSLCYNMLVSHQIQGMQKILRFGKRVKESDTFKHTCVFLSEPHRQHTLPESRLFRGVVWWQTTNVRERFTVYVNRSKTFGMNYHKQERTTSLNCDNFWSQLHLLLTAAVSFWYAI